METVQEELSSRLSLLAAHVSPVEMPTLSRMYLQWFPSPRTFWVLLLDLCLFSVFWLACLPLSVSSGGNAWICESVFLLLHLCSWRTHTSMLTTPKWLSPIWPPTYILAMYLTAYSTSPLGCLIAFSNLTYSESNSCPAPALYKSSLLHLNKGLIHFQIIFYFSLKF